MNKKLAVQLEIVVVAMLSTTLYAERSTSGEMRLTDY